MRKLIPLWWALVPALAIGATFPVTAGNPADDAARRKEIERAREDVKRAREELQRAARELAKATRELEPGSPSAEAYEFMSNPRRAMLGVTTEMGPERNGEVRGVLITGVTPGSGADKAGVKSGDLLLSANGRSLLAKPGEKPGPEKKLKAVMSELKPGDEVKLEYEREGKRASTTVIATRPHEAVAYGPMIEWDEHGAFDILVPPVPPIPPTAPTAPMPPTPPHPAIAAIMGPDFVPGLQLAKLEPDLASYFKTDGGVLVVQAPRDGSLGLKGGDVIKQIDGKPVTSPVAALERFEDASDERKVKVEVWRHGKSVKLEGAPPAPFERHMRKRIHIETHETP